MNQTINNQEGTFKKLNLFQLSLPVIAFLANMYIVPIILVLIGMTGFPILWIKSALDILIIVGTIIYYKKNGIELFKKVQFKWWYLILPIAVVVINLFKMPLMDLIFGGAQPVANGEALASLMDANIVYTAISAALIAPVIEEIIFRGVIMGTLFEKHF